MARALDLLGEFPVPTVAGAVLLDGVVVDHEGPLDHRFRLASIAKTITCWAILIAVEEGTVSLDDEIGPPPATGVRTLRHLLTHAGGYGFDGPEPIVSPERNRIYSNTGIEVAAEHVAAAAGMTFEEYLRLGLLEPLGMTATELRGSPAHAMWSNVDDIVRFMQEVTRPVLLSAETAHDAVRPHFPALGGIVPGVGRFDTCPWGMGFEIRGDKSPHWTGERQLRGDIRSLRWCWHDDVARPGGQSTATRSAWSRSPTVRSTNGHPRRSSCGRRCRTPRSRSSSGQADDRHPPLPPW